MSEQEKYQVFEIRKRNGGTRIIESPTKRLKQLQSRLSQILIQEYRPKPCIHGFVLNKSIVSNAKVHLRKRNLLNFDLKDFFPSIHFGRVRGLFKAYPFNFSDKIAIILANICCRNNHLPQGAPTSPIISNLICRTLDNELLKICINSKCAYSRYADDITISTNLKDFPSAIGKIKDNKFDFSELMTNILSRNGFNINSAKTRYANKTNRREVTGLIVNKKINIKRNYVRSVRLLLHNWEKFGIDKAALDYYAKYSIKDIDPKLFGLRYSRELIGKIGFIGFVKGKDDPVYIKLVRRIRTLEPQAAVSVVINESKDSIVPMIYGEGKSDWKHLKAAYRYFKSVGKYASLEIRIRDYDARFEVNNTTLLDICKLLPKASITKNIVICLFDADDESMVNQTTENGQDFKYWQNNVYSMVVPQPPHRNFRQVCIEHFYLDSELKTLDNENRRLYTSDEFNPNTGQHLVEPNIFYANPKYLNHKYPRIIDNSVHYNSKNVALPKNHFADYILSRKEGFKSFRFQHFKVIFDKLEEIIRKHVYE